MKESEDKKQSFVKDLFKRARRSETHDINDNRKGFAARNARYILGLTVAVVGAASLPAGFGMDFLQMAATILSVFIGLFIAALVFALDKYAPAPDSAERDYRLEISEGDTCRNVELSVDEIEYPDSRTKNARRQTHIYMAQFNAITGKSVLLSVWALALLCLNILYPHLFATDLTHYQFAAITPKSVGLFALLALLTAQRLAVIYLLTAIFYDTTRIVSSLVNYTSAHIDRHRP